MAISVLQYRIGRAEERLVVADDYEERGDARFARQAARHAAGWYEQAANEALTYSLSYARDLLVHAETNYKRGKSPVYVRKVQERIAAVDAQIQERARADKEWLEGIQAHRGVAAAQGSAEDSVL
jgi:hypothetical protein